MRSSAASSRNFARYFNSSPWEKHDVAFEKFNLSHEEKREREINVYFYYINNCTHAHATHTISTNDKRDRERESITLSNIFFSKLMKSVHQYTYTYSLF